MYDRISFPPGILALKWELLQITFVSYAVNSKKTRVMFPEDNCIADTPYKDEDTYSLVTS
jgi:hypothetical protein